MSERFAKIFDGEPEKFAVGGTHIAYRTAGSGPALLLLHGYPQTMYMWHLVAAKLAEKFTLVLADLRGYGDSGKPQTDAQHRPYSKREMAADMAALMTYLGHQKFAVMGHDRGGRVAHRLARDYEARLTGLAVLDIAPTLSMYENTDMRFAKAYYHWFFLIQPAPLPETLIGADPEFYLRRKIGSWGASGEIHTKTAMAEYLRCFQGDTIHASCEDYRAAASIDLEHDRAEAGRKLSIPVLALSGASSFVGKTIDIKAAWQEVCDNLETDDVPGGHFLAEESPAALLAACLPFFARCVKHAD